MTTHPPSPTNLPTDGNCSWIVLRLQFLADDDLLELDEEDLAAASDQRRERDWRVLIVDDDPEVHRAMDLALSGVVIHGRSLAISHCDSAAAARARLIDRHAPVDLVLLDVVMETSDAGLNLLDDIRADPGTQRLPVLLHTGQPGRAPESVIRRRYDISGYLTKSTVTRPGLIATLDSILGHASEL